ncbi:MAG: hypothetical protein U1E02_24985 [Hydrogenophaga sp.]|uniref:response regulator transcription factor n=1 Tax=Hydrogenophaga sp. TaxID=1904254 RepID=UPI002731C5C5|nr:hypothetical protein [Hydrogenophaga sp.]MDZ4127390.1 hypothetical protein [Hydrogenophaga sp.]
MIKVVVAEDHALVRQGISMLLAATGGFELVAETALGSEVEVLVAFHSPDLLLRGTATRRTAQNGAGAARQTDRPRRRAMGTRTWLTSPVVGGGSQPIAAEGTGALSPSAWRLRPPSIGSAAQRKPQPHA